MSVVLVLIRFGHFATVRSEATMDLDTGAVFGGV